MDQNSHSRIQLLRYLDEFYFSVQPRLNHTLMKQLLFGSIDERNYAKLKELNRLESCLDMSIKGLFVLVRDRESDLVAARAASLICKLIDFQKNRHAEAVVQELTRVSPQFLAEFKLDSALDIDSCHNQILTILKVYVPAQSESPDLVAEYLASDPEKVQLILDFCRQSQKQNDLTNSTILMNSGALAKQRSHISEGKRSVLNSSFSSFIKQRPVKQPTGNTLATAKSSVGATTNGQ